MWSRTDALGGTAMETAIVVFTRDLRLHDNPALHQVCARRRLDLTVTPGLTVVPPGDLAPATGGHYRVFTPYWRAWRAVRWRRPYPVPGVITMAAAGSPRGASGSWPATRTATTTWPGTRPRGSAPTCGSAVSRRWRWRSAHGAARAARNSAASWPGVTSSTR